MLAELTPLVRSITDDGQGHWRWALGGIDVLGASFAPAFTVAMTFDEPTRIDFVPAPPVGTKETASSSGWYLLEELPDDESGKPQTRLSTSVEIAVDLPLPGVARRAVEGAMQRVVDGMANAFAKNLLAHLGKR